MALPLTRGDGVFWLDAEVSNARTDPQPLAGLSLVAPTLEVEDYLAPFHPDDFEGPPPTSVMGTGEPDVQVIKAPAEPSAWAREQHLASGHARFAPWCKRCINGRGREAPHQRITEPGGIPFIHIDYHFLVLAWPKR